MKPAQKIWLNGKIAPLNSAKVLSFHQGLNYGACVYEGIRCYQTSRGPALFRLKEHIDRFFYSAAALEMKLGYSRKDLEVAIKKVLVANKISSGYIRPMAFYSDPKMGINIFNSKTTLVIFAWPWADKAAECLATTLKIVKYRRLDPATVDLRAKISGYYANGLLGFIEAQKAGFDQPLFLDKSGYLAEGAINNIFVVSGGVLYTPKTANILSGVTRDTVIKLAKDLHLRVVEKDLSPKFLRQADEIFLTGTGIQLQRVRKVAGYFNLKKIKTPIIDRIAGYYGQVVTGAVGPHKSWLNFI